ncbi:ATP-binding protein [Streptomyces sp. NPDC029003]|uniref:ATP-binding protein n=1 Tax=Streptomyces sp. NPDC029003 TaxID=3155125 RepID=UPI00340FA042
MGATVTPSWAYTLHLPHDPRAAGIARATLRAVLDRHGINAVADTAELLASELVSNAYRHTRGPCALRLRALSADRLRIGVWDTSPDIPGPFTPPTHAESGRGLLLVTLCASRYGARLLPSPQTGKLLWAECTA